MSENQTSLMKDAQHGCATSGSPSAEAIKTLQEIAWLANSYLSGACCDEHHRDNEHKLNERLRRFEDDSFQRLRDE